MRLRCDVAVQRAVSVKRGGESAAPVRPTKAVLAVGCSRGPGTSKENDAAPPSSADVALTVLTLKDKRPRLFQLKNNIANLYDGFVDKGKITLRLKEGVDILISKADAAELAALLKVLKSVQSGSTTVEASIKMSNGTSVSASDLKPLPRQMTITDRKDYPHTTGFPPCLRQLTISCGYDRIDPRWLALRALTTLDLSANTFPLARLTALKLDRLTALLSLNLAGNQLHQLPVDVWAALPVSLKMLDLSANRLTRLPPLIGRLKSLESLKLDAGNQLTQLPVAIGALTRLRRLNVDSNRLTHLPMSIKWLSNLDELYLDGNPCCTSEALLSQRPTVQFTSVARRPALMELAALTVVRNGLPLSSLPWLARAAVDSLPRCDVCRRPFAASSGGAATSRVDVRRLASTTVSFGDAREAPVRGVVCGSACAEVVMRRRCL